MNANYSEALEQQVAVLRRFESQRFKECVWDLVYKHPAARTATLTALRQADPYFWTHHMCELLSLTTDAGRFPDWMLDLSLLPSTGGFWWFSEPLALPEIEVPEEDAVLTRWLVALSWTPIHKNISGETGIAVTAYEAWTGSRTIIDLPDLIPASVQAWFPEATQNETSAESETIVGPEHGRAVLDYLAAGLLLLSQRIGQWTTRAPERHARKRIERLGVAEQPLIRVVELRRRAAQRPIDIQQAEREWSCQWLVRGHWRQQWYPKRKANNPLWITPYVKGPENKPLKPPRATVFAVVR